MTKKELFEQLESRLYGLDSTTIIKLICDCFNSNQVEEFLDHVKDEGYRKQL